MPPVINDFPKNKPTLASCLAPLARQQLGSKDSVTSPLSWHGSSRGSACLSVPDRCGPLPALLAASSHLMATDEDTLHRLLGPHWKLQVSPHLQSSHLVTLLALPPVLQEDNEVSRGADSSRWIMEIKLCVCLVIKSNAMTMALSPGPPAQVVFPYLSCTGRLPRHAVLIGAGPLLVSCRKLPKKEPRDVTLRLI